MWKNIVETEMPQKKKKHCRCPFLARYQRLRTHTCIM